MPLSLVTGPPGTGKSWFAVRHIALELVKGKYIATNVKLHDGWAMEVAKQNWVTRLFRGKSGLERQAAEYERRVFVSADLQELFAIRLAPCGACKTCKRGRPCMREERGEMVLDEAHEWLNARTWNQDSTGQKRTQDESIAERLSIVKFFALHRKLGWKVYLITQSEKRLDNQVRDNFEYHIKLKNMRKFKVFGLFPLVPFNFFVAITFWHASNNERVGVQGYRLTKLADIYDTMARPELYDSELEHGTISLPLSSDEVQARRDGVWLSPLREPSQVARRSAERKTGGLRSRPPAPPAPSPVESSTIPPLPDFTGGEF